MDELQHGGALDGPAPTPTRDHDSSAPAGATTSRTTELSPTGRVILGMLALGKRTGYDIKQFVDKSTRFFWAASYGQIYPELRRLEQQGLVRGQPEPSGGRARTVYRLTEAGREVLTAWLTSDQEPLWELRDEGMLKLFFSDGETREQQLALVRTVRARNERKLQQLREVEEWAKRGPRGPWLTLQVGIRTTEAMIEAWAATERELTSTPEE